MTIRLCLIEDDRSTLHALKQTFERERDMQVIGAFATAEQALAQTDGTIVNVLIVDLGLPGMSGIDLIGEVSMGHPQMNILVYTISEDRSTVLKAIRRGAHGYLLKGSTLKALVNPVRDLMEGGSPMSPRIAREIIRELHPKNEHPECPLTPREIDILRLVANSHTNFQIGQLLKISPQTVHTHLKNIYEKVHARNRMEASNKARDWGILR